jgi:hypothetical protein
MGMQPRPVSLTRTPVFWPGLAWWPPGLGWHDTKGQAMPRPHPRPVGQHGTARSTTVGLVPPMTPCLPLNLAQPMKPHPRRSIYKRQPHPPQTLIQNPHPAMPRCSQLALGSRLTSCSRSISHRSPLIVPVDHRPRLR